MDTDLRASERVRLGAFCADIDWCVPRVCLCRVGAPGSMAARSETLNEFACFRQRQWDHICTGSLDNAGVPNWGFRHHEAVIGETAELAETVDDGRQLAVVITVDDGLPASTPHSWPASLDPELSVGPSKCWR